MRSFSIRTDHDLLHVKLWCNAPHMQASTDIWPLYHLITYHANIWGIKFYETGAWFYMHPCLQAGEGTAISKENKRTIRFGTFDLRRCRLRKIIRRIANRRKHPRDISIKLRVFAEVSFPCIVSQVTVNPEIKLNRWKTFEQKYAWTLDQWKILIGSTR